MLRIANVHISFEGDFFSPFSLSKRRMADIPDGVAAFPVPSRFAVTFIVINFFAFSSFRFLNKRPKTGESVFSIAVLIPHLSHRLSMPDHRHIIPANERSICMLFPAAAIPAERVCCASEKKKEYTSDTIIIKLHT